MGLEVYFDAVVSLALQLEKLLKVINHSDPTAESKKRLLYHKYLQNVEQFAGVLGERYLWQDIRNFVREASRRKIPVSNEVRELIFNKILKDLENELVVKPPLQEFTGEKRTLRQRRAKKGGRQKAPERREANSKHYTRESIMELVQLTQRQVLARANLREIVAKMRELNPERIDRKIQQYIRRQKK